MSFFFFFFENDVCMNIGIASLHLYTVFFQLFLNKTYEDIKGNLCYNYPVILGVCTSQARSESLFFNFF